MTKTVKTVVVVVVELMTLETTGSKMILQRVATELQHTLWVHLTQCSLVVVVRAVLTQPTLMTCPIPGVEVEVVLLRATPESQQVAFTIKVAVAVAVLAVLVVSTTGALMAVTE
jgi:hypothetical protein